MTNARNTTPSQHLRWTGRRPQLVPPAGGELALLEVGPAVRLRVAPVVRHGCPLRLAPTIPWARRDVAGAPGGNEPPVRARSGSSIVVARDNLGCLRADRHRWVSRPSLKGAKGRDGRARRRRPERLARRRRRRHNVGGGWPGSTFTEGPKSGAVTRNPGAVQSDLVNQQARDIAGASAKRQPSRHVPFVSGGRCGDVR